MVCRSLNRSRILKFENFRIRIQIFGSGAESESENVTPATSDLQHHAFYDIIEPKSLMHRRPYSLVVSSH